MNVNTSSQQLNRRISEWFCAKYNCQTYFYSSLDEQKLHSGNVPKNITIFGDFVISMHDLSPFFDKIKSIHLLCRKSVEIAKCLYPEASELIHLIPRYELYPAGPKSKPLSQKDKLTFVYPGRISRSKNIELLVSVFYQLSKIFDCEFKLLGDYDRVISFQENSILNPLSLDQWKERFNSHLKRYQWKHKPELIRDLTPENWLSLVPTNSILISMSTYYMEDFSVSMAQGQAEGFPCIVPDLGGFSDLIGNVLKIPNHFIRSNNTEIFGKHIDTYALKIAEYIKNNFKTLNSMDTALSPLIKSSIRLPGNIQDIRGNRIIHFFANPIGQKFMHQYYKVWGSSKTKIKYSFFTTDEYVRWRSLVEIISEQEKLWINKIDTDTNVNFYEKHHVNGHIKDILSATAWVFSAITRKLQYTLRVLREELPSKVPLFAYTHESTSLLCSNYHQREISPLLRSCDTLLLFNPRDLELANKSYTNIHTKLVSTKFFKEVKTNTTPLGDFTYLGRISEQKCLHQLVFAAKLSCKLLRQNKKKINIIGWEDHYGSPNMRMESKSYSLFLHKLIKNLNVQDICIMHPPLPSKQVESYIKENKCIGVFPSLHSDENFGMVPIIFYQLGLPTIISDWGGFGQFQNSFGKLVDYLQVYKTSLGPVLNPFEISKKLDYYSSLKTPPRGKLSSDFFNIEQTAERISDKKYTETKVEITRQSKKLMAHLKLPHHGQNQKALFNGYDDPNVQDIFKIYGMNSEHSIKYNYLVPWVTIKQGKIIIEDHHRGITEIDYDETNDKRVNSVNGEVFLSTEQYEKLSKEGYIY
jgi:glycosyltransferase involved in cell wall biosynthesis